MRDEIGTEFFDRLLDRFGVEQIAVKSLPGGIDRAVAALERQHGAFGLWVIRGEGGGEMRAHEACAACQENAFVASHRVTAAFLVRTRFFQPASPRLRRSRSASTISLMRSLSAILGAQPSLALAFEELPSSTSTSAGR